MLRCNNTEGVSPMASIANINRSRAGHDTSGQANDFLGFATLFRGVQLLTRQMADRRAARHERAQIARELSSYTDRELGELGFSRADLPMIAAGTYRR
jgi:uncharacterized protein YjiS (DUF1127 family)